MYIDKLAEFCDATSVAAAAGTALVGNVMDLGAAGRDIGGGQPVYLVITVDTEVITGGSAGTIVFQLASDSVATIDSSATIHLSTASLVTDDSAANSALLNAGAVVTCVSLPAGALYERYLGILCVIGTTTVTAGKINAFLTADPTGWRAYPNAI